MIEIKTTVRELHDMLIELPPEAEVIIIDSEQSEEYQERTIGGVGVDTKSIEPKLVITLW